MRVSYCSGNAIPATVLYGMSECVLALLCNATELVKFCKRIGKERGEVIFVMSVNLHGKDTQEKQVIIDTTVQEKNITYPADSKLAIKMIHHLHKIAKEKKTQIGRAPVSKRSKDTEFF